MLAAGLRPASNLLQTCLRPDRVMEFGFKKVRNQIMHCFPPHLSRGSALPCKTGNPEIASFHVNTVCCFANEHTEHIQIITWLQ